jgi:hypothetical protein
MVCFKNSPEKPLQWHKKNRHMSKTLDSISSKWWKNALRFFSHKTEKWIKSRKVDLIHFWVVCEKKRNAFFHTKTENEYMVLSHNAFFHTKTWFIFRFCVKKKVMHFFTQKLKMNIWFCVKKCIMHFFTQKLDSFLGFVWKNALRFFSQKVSKRIMSNCLRHRLANYLYLYVLDVCFYSNRMRAR